MRLREGRPQVMMISAKYPTGPTTSSVGRYSRFQHSSLHDPESGGLAMAIYWSSMSLLLLASVAILSYMCGSLRSSALHSLLAHLGAMQSDNAKLGNAVSHHPLNTTFPSQPLRPSLILPVIQLAVAPLTSIDAVTTRRIPYLDRGLDKSSIPPSAARAVLVDSRP